MSQKAASTAQECVVVANQNLRVAKIGARHGYFFVKRIFDIVFSSLGLILCLPIWLVVAIAIKAEDGGPVFYKQIRTGKGGKNFTIYKFRSCVTDNYKYKTDHLTKVGKIIRKTSIDETPQLINVINGTMSIIGPRPWIIEYYDNMNDEQRRRYDVLPGITGLAQINGRNNLNIFKKIQHDIDYVDNCSVRMDLKIVASSIRAVFDQGGISPNTFTIRKELADLKEQNHKK